MIDLDAWWVEAHRVAKPRAAIVCTGSQPFTTTLIASNIKRFRYEWVWVKSLPTGHLNARRNPLKQHENVMVFYEALGVYNCQMSRGKAYSATSGAAGGYVRDKSTANHTTVNTGERFPTTVLKFASPINPLHPTQKPVALFEYLIRTYTQPGDLVLDPFVGSGTTALAARACGRRYICGDQSQEYVNIALDRLRLPFEPRHVQQETRLDDLPLFAGLGGDQR